MCNGENERLRPGLRECVPPRLSERGSGVDPHPLATQNLPLLLYLQLYNYTYSYATTFTAMQLHLDTIELHIHTIQLCVYSMIFMWKYTIICRGDDATATRTARACAAPIVGKRRR